MSLHVAARRQHPFNAAIFEDQIHQKCAGKVKGYSFVITSSRGFEAKVSSGYAQAPKDGNVLMKTHVASCIGSASKVLSGIALLNLFDKHKLADISVQEQLDTSIWNKLPTKWQDSFPNRNIEKITYRLRNIEKITYRLLLQHKSGFRVGDTEASNNTQGTKMSYVIARGVKQSDIGIRKYNNFNFWILLYLIPAIAYPKSVEKIHSQYKHLDVNEYSKKIESEYSELYCKYMHEEIFSKAIEKINGTCKPLHELKPEAYARHYSSMGAEKGGVLNRDYCLAQGGWYITAQHFAIFAQTFAFTNRYIGPTTRASLYNQESKQTRDDRLVYNRLLSNPRLGRGKGIWPFHGGMERGYRAAFISLPYEYYGVGMTNSPEFSSGKLAEIISDSFYFATRGTAA